MAAGNQVNTTSNVRSTNGGNRQRGDGVGGCVGSGPRDRQDARRRFVKGQTADYTITVSNAGAGSTTGTITVTNTLPAGLTATAMSGTGWTCNVGTLTCTRSDALAAGTSYPPITLTVSVAPTAPSSLSDTAAVSGGGDTSPANNSATEITGREAALTPTLGTWAFLFLAVLALIAARALRVRRTF